MKKIWLYLTKQQKKMSILWKHMMMMVCILALALIVLTILGLPSITGQEASEDPAAYLTEPPTLPPTEPEPTLPPPEENPFDRLDFQYEDNYLKLRDGVSHTGIDVSHWQKDIDWEQVKASGVEFAMIRLGYRGYEQN